MKLCVLILETDKEITVKKAEELLSIGSEETCLYFGYGVELNGLVVFVIDTESGDEESRQKLHERLLEACPGAKLAWSAAYEGGRNLRYAYEEAQYILHSATNCYEGVLTLAQIQQEEEGQVRTQAVYNINNLKNAVQNGEVNQISDLVEEICRFDDISLSGIKTAAVQIYSQIMASEDIQKVSFTQAEMHVFHNIQVRAKTVEEVRVYLCQALVHEASKNSSMEISRDEQLVRKMEKYVDENYDNVLLSVDSLCQVFERSASGVNKAFKNVTGQGPLYYINYRRIQEAKRLFVESEGKYSASEVLKMVGYTNLNTFTRAFKKTEGITPGKFRDTVLQANQHSID